MKKLQQRGLHTKSQPLEKLDRVLDEIRKLMLISIEVFSKGELKKGEPAITAGKQEQQQQQQHSWRGARGKLQGKVLDPGGF
jgi:hypothetical protein